MTDSAAKIAATGHPGDDERFWMLDAAMKRVQYAPEALIEVLHFAQKLFGCLDHGLLHYVAHGLKLPPQQGLRCRDRLPPVHLRAPGKAHLRGVHGDGLLCTGSGAAHGRGSKECLAISPVGKTTPDGKVSLLDAHDAWERVGSLAVVAVYDGEVMPAAKDAGDSMRKPRERMDLGGDGAC